MHDVYATVNTGALAAVPRLSEIEPAVAPIIAPAVPPPQRAVRPRQAMLFADQPPGKVIPFDGVLEAPAPRAKPAVRTAARPQTRCTGLASDAQPLLEFLQPAPQGPRKLSTTVEAVIDCDAPVASPMHRACAAAIDGSMIAIACGLFLTTFYLMGGSLAGKPAFLMMGAAILLIAMFYGFVWVCAGSQTPGMRALRLTLINFDGYAPDGTMRWLRYLGACLGYCAGGLGLLWALLDEEGLSWHDHISKTFPTFHGPETSFVRRR